MADRRELRDGGGGRGRLLEAAAQQFAAKGYAGTSVRDLLRAAGVTAPVLYHHFGSKEGLFLALLRDARAKVEAARAAALGSGGPAAARILRLSRAHCAVRRQYASLAWVVEQILSGPPEAAPAFDFRGVALESLRRFEVLVEEGVASGEFRPCSARHAALALMGALEIAARPHIWEAGGGRSDEQLEGMLAVILAGLAAAPVAPGSLPSPAPIKTSSNLPNAT